MTTIIRSDSTLSAPTAGSLILPNLGISGIRHRWHAASALGAVDGTITRVNDSAGSADLTAVTGSVVLRQTPVGRRYLDLGSAAGDNIVSASYTQAYSAFSLAMLYYWETVPAGAYNVLSTSALGGTPSGLNLLNSRYGAGTWNAGGISIATPPDSSKVAGWHTIMVGYSKTGQEMAAIDGAIARGEGHGTIDPLNVFALRGSGALKSRMVDAVYVDHVMTDAEIATLHARLIAQAP